VLHLDNCRTQLGHDCSLGNPELESLRDEFYVLANLAVDLFLNARNGEDNANDRKGANLPQGLDKGTA
jgi:hypothetical protein